MNRFYLIFVTLILSVASMTAQEQQAPVPKYVLTLDDVVQLARAQSIQAIQARHRFRAAYFSQMEFKATFLPKLTLTASPTSWDKSIQTIPYFDKDVLKIKETKANTFTSSAGLALSQNIGLTGGTVSLGSDFKRQQNFLEKNSEATTQYTTTPIRLSLSQPLSGYNQFRWKKKIEPLRYEEAKQNYIVAMENVSSRAVSMFFALAIAQANLKVAETNLKNQNELYEISKGRYQLGIIAEDQLLQVQLRHMQSEGKLNNTQIEIHSRLNQLRSFLGFKDNVEIELIVNPEVPSFQVNYEEALYMALSKNPEIIAYNRQLLEAERAVAQAKSQTGVTLDLNASFGVNKTGYAFSEAYATPYSDREGISLRINVPILDGKEARNRYRNAQSSLEIMEAQIQQQETDFKQDVFLQVMSFNMQENQLRIAAMTDTIAQKSYDISHARYMVGKGNITVLNLADTEKDNAKIGYMRELRSYWDLYYTIRRLTLYDFLNNKPLEEDFDRIVGE